MCVKQLMAELHAETAEQLGDTEGPLQRLYQVSVVGYRETEEYLRLTGSAGQSPL